MFNKCIVVNAESPVHTNTSKIEKSLSQIEHNQQEELLHRDRVEISLIEYNKLLSYQKENEFIKALFGEFGMKTFPYNDMIVAGSLKLYESHCTDRLFDDKGHFRLEFDVKRRSY